MASHVRHPGSAGVLAQTNLQTEIAAISWSHQGSFGNVAQRKLTLHLLPQIIHLRQGQRREV